MTSNNISTGVVCTTVPGKSLSSWCRANTHIRYGQQVALPICSSRPARHLEPMMTKQGEQDVSPDEPCDMLSSVNGSAAWASAAGTLPAAGMILRPASFTHAEQVTDSFIIFCFGCIALSWIRHLHTLVPTYCWLHLCSSSDHHSHPALAELNRCMPCSHDVKRHSRVLTNVALKQMELSCLASGVGVASSRRCTCMMRKRMELCKAGTLLHLVVFCMCGHSVRLPVQEPASAQVP